MSGGGGGEKTEKPTAKKLKEARREGQVARSQDVGAWSALLAATVLVPHVGSAVAQVVTRLLLDASAAMRHPDPNQALRLFTTGLRDGAVALIPLLGATMLVAVAAAGAQGGLHPATKKLKPQMSHLNALKGIKRLFGMMTLWEGAKVLVKTGAMGLVLFVVVRRVAPTLVSQGDTPLANTLATTASSVLTLVRLSVTVGLVMAVADYLVQKRKIDKQLKMSRHEIQQEAKQSEGDPHVRGHRRSLQMAMSRNRMMADLADADVVLVNPTHVAVALRYEPGKGAPRVVARGAGAIAAAIREKATEARVPLVEDVPLARALYKACEVGQEIPGPLYAAVAQVLAFVMALRAKGAAAGTHRASQPSVIPA
jgi:flagellar biosynthesis protein FlhB